MDIQISSNFERLLFDIGGRNGEQVSAYMEALQSENGFELRGDHLAKLRHGFGAGRVSDSETQAVMKDCYERTGYLADPHTAVGLAIARKNGAATPEPMITLATAHPAKFGTAVEEACEVVPQLPPHMSDLFERDEEFTVLANDKELLKQYILQGDAV